MEESLLYAKHCPVEHHCYAIGELAGNAAAYAESLEARGRQPEVARATVRNLGAKAAVREVFYPPCQGCPRVARQAQ